MSVIIFALFYCLLDLIRGECNVISLYVLCCPVNRSVCFVCCMFEGVYELFGETIRNMFGYICYFLLNVMELLCVVGGVWSSIECVCCACGHSESLDAPSICFVCVFFMS